LLSTERSERDDSSPWRPICRFDCHKPDAEEQGFIIGDHQSNA